MGSTTQTWVSDVFAEFELEGLRVQWQWRYPMPPSPSVVTLQRALVHVADAVHHDELSFNGVDHVVTEHSQRSETVELVSDLEATRPRFDVVQCSTYVRVKALAFFRSACFQCEPRLFNVLLRFPREPNLPGSLVSTFLHTCLQFLARKPFAFATQETTPAGIEVCHFL